MIQNNVLMNSRHKSPISECFATRPGGWLSVWQRGVVSSHATYSSYIETPSAKVSRDDSGKFWKRSKRLSFPYIFRSYPSA